MQFGLAKAATVVLLLMVSGGALAQVPSSPPTSSSTQTIPLLDNRFRLDRSVASVTLLIQRKDGTKPVVLVRPDGSKWYAHRHPESVKWNFTDNSDMIRIDAPTAGPWQVVGTIEPSSQVRVLSGLSLQHQPFPEQIFRGQRLKLSAEIVGDGQRIAMRDFYQQLRWRVALASENRSGDENFGSGTFQIGDYQDSGEGLDERPDDGVFAAELDFDFPAGLYTAQVTVANPVFSRKVQQQIELLPQPLRLSVSGELGETSMLHIDSDDNLLLQELHLSLQLLTPEQRRFNLELTPSRLQFALPLTDAAGYGSYQLTGSVVGTTVAGREFYLTLPKLDFHRTPPPPPPPSAEQLRQQTLAAAAVKEQQARDRVMSVLTVSVAAALLLIVAVLAGQWWWRRRPAVKPTLQQVLEPELTADQVDFSAFAQANNLTEQK
ncbi:TIGR03503 family protein [Ferrimonas senticii]|uniref:TIGR03503 family protein n=1 Tax=Ferrimonas senticii TaxID=394566 RepID=UPI00040B4CD3|nr:TIGR03503 family protein [Ferrimonas senticii]